LPRDLRSGGFSAMNVAALAALERMESVSYVGPIDLRANLDEKVVSKALRVAGLPGAFFQFSKRRLAGIAREVEVRSSADAKLDFFHGFTPWILTRPPRPYLAWSDCSFADYIDIYHDRRHFLPADLERIERVEAAWLRRAARVMFTSQWAAARAITRYGLEPARVGCVGIFGEIEAPEIDGFEGGETFAFISTNFRAKGGPTVLAAFRTVRLRHPKARLTVVGDGAPGLASEPGVLFEGFLRKEYPDENSRLRQILGKARALVHPTRSDVTPLMVVEAAYFGCPAISSRNFAIPELIDNGRTGFLLEDPSDSNALAGVMEWMLEHEGAYLKMREAAALKCRTEFSKHAFENRLQSQVLAITTRISEQFARNVKQGTNV